MRTTLNVDGHLLTAAKDIATRRKCSVGTVIEEALRGFLTPIAGTVAGARRYELPEGGRGGLVPGIDIDHSASLLEAMEKDDGAYGR
jgi:hypothetical protein